jgi:hypothetical protein
MKGLNGLEDGSAALRERLLAISDLQLGVAQSRPELVKCDSVAIRPALDRPLLEQRALLRQSDLSVTRQVSEPDAAVGLI